MFERFQQLSTPVRVGLFLAIPVLIIVLLIAANNLTNAANKKANTDTSQGTYTASPTDTPTTVAPTTSPTKDDSDTGVTSTRYTDQQKSQAAIAASKVFLAYCRYIKGENATQHVARLKPYFVADSSDLNPSNVIPLIVVQQCNVNAFQPQAVGKDGTITVSVAGQAATVYQAGAPIPNAPKQGTSYITSKAGEVVMKLVDGKWLGVVVLEG